MALISSDRPLSNVSPSMGAQEDLIAVKPNENYETDSLSLFSLRCNK